MLILDFNQNVISNVMVQIGNHTNVPIQIGLIRHMVLNQIRLIRQRYKLYGDLVVATDGRHYWRKNEFKYYKINRSVQRENSDFDWNGMFDCINTIREELELYMPYPTIHLDGVEADDIIGTLCMTADPNDNIMIISGDGDFCQLQRYGNVKQYDPVRARDLTVADPLLYLREHIIRGDAGDGIPNIMSPDDVFVTEGTRQKKITQKILTAWMEWNRNDPPPDENAYRNFIRNEKLIDLSKIPQDIQSKILAKYREQSNKDRSKLFNYFISKQLRNLTELINEF